MRISSLADHYGMNSKQLVAQNKNRLSDFRGWNRLPLAEYWFLFENNIGYYVGMDGTSVIGNFVSSKIGKVKST